MWYDRVRPGLLLYGLVPPPLASTLRLAPIMTLRSRIVAVKGIRPGEGVGYGSRFRPEQPARIAIVPAGYADGLAAVMATTMRLGCDVEVILPLTVLRSAT